MAVLRTLQLLQAPAAQEAELGTFYAVKVGRIPGVYTDSAAADEQTNGYSGAQAKSFRSYTDAETFVQAQVSNTILHKNTVLVCPGCS